MPRLQTLTFGLITVAIAKLLEVHEVAVTSTMPGGKPVYYGLYFALIVCALANMVKALDVPKILLGKRKSS